MPGRVGREARALREDDRVVDDVHRDVQDRRLVVAPPLRPADGNVEELLAFDHVSTWAWAAMALVTTLLTSAVVTPHFWHLSGSTRNCRCVCAADVEDADVRDPLDVLQNVSWPCRPAAPSLSMSGPKILIELSPLTPDIASSTLSRMFWEKFHMTPGMSRSRSAFMAVTSSRFVRARMGPKDPTPPAGRAARPWASPPGAAAGRSIRRCKNPRYRCRRRAGRSG